MDAELRSLKDSQREKLWQEAEGRTVLPVDILMFIALVASIVLVAIDSSARGALSLIFPVFLLLLIQSTRQARQIAALRELLFRSLISHENRSPELDM